MVVIFVTPLYVWPGHVSSRPRWGCYDFFQNPKGFHSHLVWWDFGWEWARIIAVVTETTFLSNLRKNNSPNNGIIQAIWNTTFTIVRDFFLNHCKRDLQGLVLIHLHRVYLLKSNFLLVNVPSWFQVQSNWEIKHESFFGIRMLKMTTNTDVHQFFLLCETKFFSTCLKVSFGCSPFIPIETTVGSNRWQKTQTF